MYSELRKASNAKKENNDCAVVAHAVVTGKTYEEAHATLKFHGRKDNCGTYTYVTNKAMKASGFKPVIKMSGVGTLKGYINLRELIIENYAERHHCRKYVTTKHASDKEFGSTKGWELLKKISQNFDVAILVHTPGHICAFKNGKFEDHTHGRKCKIQDITIWLKNGAKQPEEFYELAKYIN